jgi:hypothetical protein
VSALRLSCPGRAPEFTDLGPARWVPLHGHATLGGHIVRPAPAGLITDAERARSAEWKRAHRVPSTPESRAKDVERRRRHRERAQA